MSSPALDAEQAEAGADAADADLAAATAAYKQLFRTLGSGIAVVSADGPDGPVGMTVSSLMAMSLTPPLLLVSLATASLTLAALRRSGRFAVNLLHDDQQHLAARFASPRPAWVKFAGVALAEGRSAPPILHDVLAAVVCDLSWVRPAGDHALVLGEIVSADVASGRPLVWHASGYHGVHSRPPR